MHAIAMKVLVGLIPAAAMAQGAAYSLPAFTKADTLRGSIGPNRAWWNVLHYDVEVWPEYRTETITARCGIRFASKGGRTMQIDLQQPLLVDSVVFQQQQLPFERDGNLLLVEPGGPQGLAAGEYSLQVYYHGTPRRARRAPWDGGWVWSKDALGRPWMTVACQTLGASAWYPCKDHQSDEPDQGAALTVVVPDTLVAVANGRLKSKLPKGDRIAWRWEVRNPINSYNLVPYIGKYESFAETYQGEEGQLDCTYWVLDYNLEKAKQQFQQVRPMLQCFEYWFGPYPFYEDGYQLVEAPHLGMEHQSAVAYGNQYLNGYLGRDLSGSGWGNRWDFIIIHESGHEWFGNNVTSKDIADMWIHEGFTNYSETIFTQCQHGLAAGEAYVQGIRRNIRNDRPIIGQYGVHHQGSGDMYYKGANMIHSIRTAMQNDSLFRQMLRGINQRFYHQTTTTSELMHYMQSFCRFDLKPIFDQYLTTTQIPVLEWKLQNKQLSVRFTNCYPAFTMPVFLPTATGQGVWKKINTGWTTVATQLTDLQTEQQWNQNLYIYYQKAKRRK